LSQGKRGQGRLAKVTENGVEFTSYLDGSKHLFTPENVIDSQLDIGADIIMPLDFCPSAEENYQEIERAVNITNDWFAKAFNHFVKQPEAKNTALFAIIQGGTYPELRKKAYEYLRQFSVQGFSIGGVANAGESKEKQKAALDATLPLLPEDKPRYLMGVGEPEDLLIGVEAGVDMFDCVTPTRLGRHGVIYTKKGKINLLNVKYRADKSILDEDCDCPACQGFAKGYVSHLLRENEVLGIRLTTLHNLRFLLRLMEDVRISIDNGRFKTFKKSFLKEYLDKTV
jgi:queuine tRNA-ribosyltransferase